MRATPKPLAIVELCERLGRITHLDTTDIRSVLNELAEVIPQAIAEGHSVEVFGLGTFSRATRKARVIRNPQTKQLMQLEETVTVKFTAAKAAKERLK